MAVGWVFVIPVRVQITGFSEKLTHWRNDHANNTQIKLCVSQAISPVRIQL
jgi:hypothetical protein